MKRTQKIVLALVTLATLGILASSYARGMGMGPDGGCAMAGKEGKGMGNPGQIDNRLAKMKKNLSITAEQEAAWSLFANTVKQQKTEMMSAMQGQMQQASGAKSAKSAPDSITERIKLMKQRVAGMETVASAMQQLYVVLTAKQQEMLDARFGQGMQL